MTQKVPALRAGGEIRIVAPAGVVTPARIGPIADRLRDAGFTVTFGAHVFDTNIVAPYLAGADQARADDVMQAFADPMVGAVLCARGGYGCMRTFGLIDTDLIRAHPKPLAGFSDITALLGLWERKCDLGSLHAPMLSTMNATLKRFGVQAMEAQLDPLIRALCIDEPQVFGGLHTVRPGRAAGPVLVGNLTLLVACLGTSWFPSAEGRILVIEEVGESPYKIDRLLTTLEISGVFEAIAGFVVGDLGGAGDGYVAEADVAACVGSQVQSIAERWGLPCVTGMPVGHREFNRAIAFGAPATLDAGAGTLSVESILLET